MLTVRRLALVLAALAGVGGLAACSASKKPTLGEAAAAGPTTSALDDTTITEPPTAPASTIVSLTGGDGAKFCAAFDQTFPVLFVIGLAQADGDAQVALAEVAMAPVLDGPLGQLLAAAPKELTAPYAAWKARNDQALAAFRTVGAPDKALGRYVDDVRGELTKVQDGSGDGGGLDDPAAYAAKRGIDRAKLASAASSFAQSAGTFDTVNAGLDAPLEATTAVREQLSDQYPCLADFVDSADG